MPGQVRLKDLQHQGLEAASIAILAADFMGEDPTDSLRNEDSSDEDSETDCDSDSDSVMDFDEMVSESRQDMALMLQAVGAVLAEEAMALGGDGRRGPYFQKVLAKEWFTRALELGDEDFRYIFRMSRPTFNTFCDILKKNPIFLSKGRKPQRDVSWQLGAFLIRYGQLGSPVKDTALKMGIGVGTVVLYCRRVIRAIRMLKSKYAGWPSDERQREIAACIKENTGFTGFVGSGDGSLVMTLEKPQWMGTAYLSRKGFMAYSVFAIVDHDIKFIAWDLGWPGSVTDARVFKQSHFWRNRHQYLPEGRRILVDKGYLSTPFSMRPYSETELAQASFQDRRRMKNFNYHLSKQRITVEHTFGCFKLRFRSMQVMGGHKEVQDVWRAIEAMMVMNNMCLYHDDHPNRFAEWTPGMGDTLEKEPAGNDLDEPEEVAEPFLPTNIPAHETDVWLRTEGFRLRNELLDTLFPV